MKLMQYFQTFPFIGGININNVSKPLNIQTYCNVEIKKKFVCHVSFNFPRADKCLVKAELLVVKMMILAKAEV